MAKFSFNDSTPVALVVDLHKGNVPKRHRHVRRAIHMLGKVSTVGEYRALRAARGLDGLGGAFRSLVAQGAVELR